MLVFVMCVCYVSFFVSFVYSLTSVPGYNVFLNLFAKDNQHDFMVMIAVAI